MPDILRGHAFDLFFTRSTEKKTTSTRQIDSSSGLAVFIAKQQDPAHWMSVGQTVQRFALTATLLGLKHAFINQPIEVLSLRPQLASLVGTPGLQPDILLRFGYGSTLPYSARRSVTSVLA